MKAPNFYDKILSFILHSGKKVKSFVQNSDIVISMTPSPPILSNIEIWRPPPPLKNSDVFYGRPHMEVCVVATESPYSKVLAGAQERVRETFWYGLLWPLEHSRIYHHSTRPHLTLIAKRAFFRRSNLVPTVFSSPFPLSLLCLLSRYFTFLKFRYCEKATKFE